MQVHRKKTVKKELKPVKKELLKKTDVKKVPIRKPLPLKRGRPYCRKCDRYFSRPLNYYQHIRSVSLLEIHYSSKREITHVLLK